MKRTLLVWLVCCSSVVGQIVVSGGGQSVVMSGHGRPVPVASDPAAARTDDNPPVAPPDAKPEWQEVRYLVSEPWCQYCPAAKRRFLAAGHPASNIINIAAARKLGHQWSGSVPHEFTVRTRVRSNEQEFEPATTTRRIQVQPARVQWNGREYNPRTYRRCGNPRCQMCNYITSARVWQTTSVTLPAGQQPTPDDIVAEMLGLMDLTSSDVLADLGCGDGRILIEAATRYGCRGVGVEIDSDRADDARREVADAGLSDQITIITGDVRDFDADEHGVTAVTAYLYPELLSEISATISSVRVAATPFHAVPGLESDRVGSVYLYRGD